MRFLHSTLNVLSLFWLSGPALSQSASTQTSCNNAPALCSRSYSNITQLGAHNSPFLVNAATGYSLSGNQFYDSITQLDAGVRLLTAQVHNFNNTWRLCHTSCNLLDAGTLIDWLSTIKNWLDSNKNDVVTILLVNSDNASPSDLASGFQAANMVSYAYTPPSTTAALAVWPTLESLIANNTRLVTFVANLDPSSNTVAPYLLNQYHFIFENSYNNTSPGSFSCQPDRPSSVVDNISGALSSGLLPLMNHFLYNSSNLLGITIDRPAIENITTTNAASGGAGNLGDSAATCTAQWNRAPAFVVVDFFNVGPAIDTVDRLNGVQGATAGRASINPAPSAISSSSSSSAASTSSASAGKQLRRAGTTLIASLAMTAVVTCW